MRAALALYALRFGGWLLARGTGAPVLLTVEVHGAEITTLRRAYPDDDAYVAAIVVNAIRNSPHNVGAGAEA